MHKSQLYKSILRQVKQQYESKNGNKIWRSILSQNFRKDTKNLDVSDAQNILQYLQGAGEYNRLMSLYWPEESLTDKEKIVKTAARVGLSVPEEYCASPLAQDGSDTPANFPTEDTTSRDTQRATGSN